MAGFGEVEEILEQLISQEPGLALGNTPTSLTRRRKLSSTLRHDKHLQTNQFEVWKRLAGLDERLRIRNNDELADALRDRLETVKSPTTEWLPEILSLFLQLSNDPANETRIESLERLERGLPPPALTWQQIIQDDPLDNNHGIWDVPNYGERSSDESEVSTPRALPPKPRPSKKAAKEDEQLSLDLALNQDPIEESLLEDLANAQFWKKQPESTSRITITEIQMIREVLFMLLGLPTSVFRQSPAGTWEPTTSYALADVSFETVTENLVSFAQIGNQLSLVRRAIKTPNLAPFVQSLQSSLGSALAALQMRLCGIETSIISPSTCESISLIQLLDEVQLMARPLLYACAAAATVLDSSQNPFAALEALYDLILQLQSVEESDSYSLAIDLFLDCLTAYLMPISAWMESGSLDPDGDTFFVVKVNKEVPLGQLWTDQYDMIKLENGSIRAPRFLYLAAKKIFNTGKSIVMLRQLEQYQQASTPPSHASLSDLLRKYLSVQTLCPFEETFAVALNTWIANHHHSYSSILRSTLETSCGLEQSIDAIEYIYFSRNGHFSSQIASLIFARLDSRKGRVWHDRFILTEIHHEALASVQCVDVQRLAVTLVPLPGNVTPGSKSVKELAKMRLVYTLPWSVSTIIKPSSFVIFQSISTFLLQISRSRYLLQHVYQSFSARPSRLLRKQPVSALSLSLHHRFLWFLNTLYEYLTDTVLLQASATLRTSMTAAQDVDQMIGVYESFAQHVGEGCLVDANRAGIRKAIVSILDLVVLFEGVDTLKMAAPIQSRARRRRQGDGSSESDVSDSGDGAPVHVPPHRQNVAADTCQLTNISGTFDKLLHFIVASLGQAQNDAIGKDHSFRALLDNLSLGVRRN